MSQTSTELIQQELKALRKLLETKNSGPTWGSQLKGVQGIVYILIVLIGIGVSWGVSTAKLGAMETKVSSVDAKVHNLELKQAGDDAVYPSLQRDINEIKRDIKELLANKNRSNPNAPH